MTQSIEQQGDSLVDLLAHTSFMYHRERERGAVTVAHFLLRALSFQFEYNNDVANGVGDKN